MKFGIFSTLSNPLLPLLLDRLHELLIKDFFIVLDDKDFSSKEKEIWLARTGGELGFGLTLSDLSKYQTPFYFVADHNGIDCINLLKRLSPKLMVNAGTPRKLKQEILDIPFLGFLNVHPGVLPKYRGSSCVEWAILNDDLIGNSAHFMTSEYDQGPVIDLEIIGVTNADNYMNIRINVYKSWIGLISRSIIKVLPLKDKPDPILDVGPKSIFSSIGKAEMLQVVEKISSGSYIQALTYKAEIK